MKTTLIALITLLFAVAAPAQESIQNQLDGIAQRQRDLEGAIEIDQSNRFYAEFERQLAADAQAERQAEQAQAWQLFKMCVDSGLSSEACARIWLH